MARIELDTVYLKDLDAEVLVPIAQETGARATVIQEYGPAGGWPVVAWEGSREQLRAVQALYNL